MTKATWFAVTVMMAGLCVLAAYAAEPASGPASKPSTQSAKELTLDLGNKITMKLTLIPSGKFMMGSPKNDEDRVENEHPQHEVTISKAFFMGIYEVTQEQYGAITGENPSGNGLAEKRPQNPVETVSWEDAVEFCKKLSAKTGKSVRLPTEAEWEYACRAGTTTPFSTGQTISTDDANYNGDKVYGDGKKGKNRKATIAVGSLKPNAFGLYDMHGNVWEWCLDWYDSYEDAASTDPKGPASGMKRVLRGGGWGSDPLDCRSAVRRSNPPEFSESIIGFRVVVDVK